MVSAGAAPLPRAMGIPITQLDVFTAEPFRGNPAVVCFLDKPRDAGRMQAVVREMNLSETAFLLEREDGFDRAGSPRSWRETCAATPPLASAHALEETADLSFQHYRQADLL